MTESKDIVMLLKEVKGLYAPATACTESFRRDELSDKKLQRHIMEVEHSDQLHGAKSQIVVADGDELCFECRGIDLDDRLGQISLGEGELLLVRVRRRQPNEKKSQRAGEEHKKRNQGKSSFDKFAKNGNAGTNLECYYSRVLILKIYSE